MARAEVPQSPTVGRHAVAVVPDASSTSWWRQRWNAATGAVGVVVGLVPHVLHHVGALAGTALVAGSGGTALFGVLGLVLSIPLLVRLNRRFGGWHAPVIALAVFAAMFALSTWVIGPAISGSGGGGSPIPSLDHSGHH